MDELDRKLDQVFAGTFHSLDKWFGDSGLVSSFDLRDQKHNYVVRLYLPNVDTSKVNARVENDVLHVTVAAEQNKNGTSKTERYEQIVSLPGPVQSDKMQIERKKDLVVINLPKSSSSVASSTQQVQPGVTPRPRDLAGLDQSVINRMSQMQRRMEQLFRDAFPHDLTTGFHALLGSAVNIEDQKNRYVAHFYLPDKDLKNVSVTLDNGQLRLSASENERSQANGASRSESGRYEQVVTLPGPVKQKGMKVERKEGAIVVTLPKA